MATVTNNLTRINDVETTFTTGNIPSGGGGAGANTDIYLQGAQSLGRRQTNTNNTGGFALIDDADNDCSATGTHVGVWLWVTQYALLDDLRISLGSGTTPANNYVYWNVPLTEYPSLGGWLRVWVENNVGSTVGAGTYTSSQTRHYGAQVSFTASPGGTSPNLIIDSADYGVGSALTLTGTSGIWDDFTTADENINNQYGVLRNVGGVYNLLARVQLGTSASSLAFSDSGWTLVFPQQALVSDSWMGVNIDLQNANTSIVWNSSTIVSSGTKQGDLVVTGTAGSFTASGCTMSNVRLITLSSSTTIDGSLITGSGQIALNGATITNCTISNSTASSALLAGSSLSTLSNTTFVSDGTSHAIEITGGTSHDLIDITFTDYEPGTTGSPVIPTDTNNEAIFVNVLSGTVTISVSGGNIPSIRSAGATVNVQQSAFVTLTGIQPESEVRAYVGTNPATSTEIAGIESTITVDPDDSTKTIFEFSQSFSGQQGYIIVLAFGYVAVYLPITYGSANVSIPIQQTVDRVYSNPVGV